MMMLNFKTIFLVLLLLFLFSVASTLDFKDKKIEHEYNCKMVELGHYPKQFCK